MKDDPRFESKLLNILVEKTFLKNADLDFKIREKFPKLWLKKNPNKKAHQEAFKAFVKLR